MTEFSSTITNPRRVSPAYEPETALQEVEKFLALPGLFLLSIPASVVVRWLALARQYGISQSEIFDAQLAATMLEHGIRRIYTFTRALPECNGLSVAVGKAAPGRVSTVDDAVDAGGKRQQGQRIRQGRRVVLRRTMTA